MSMTCVFWHEDQGSFRHLPMPDMIQAQGEQRPDMLVINRVIGHFPLSAKLHQTQGTQHAQLMGNSGRSHPQDLGQVADAQLFREQGMENLDSRRISETLEDLRQVIGLVFGEHSLAHLRDPFRVEKFDFTKVSLFVGSVWVHDRINSEQLWLYLNRNAARGFPGVSASASSSNIPLPASISAILTRPVNSFRAKPLSVKYVDRREGVLR